MISDENIIKMADQLGQTIANVKEMADIIQVLIKRIEKLENETQSISALN